MSKEIIGITGTNGSGKDTLANYLVEEKGFKFMSARDFLLEEINKKKIKYSNENVREMLIEVANDLRDEHGPSYITEQLFKKANEESKDEKIAFGSLRTPGEIIYLREKGNCLIVGVGAFWFIRYLRIIKRKGITDRIGPIKFLRQELKERKNDDPNKQNLRKCEEMSDYVIKNNWSLKRFNKKIDKTLEKAF
ncbi:AAA family ATPase [Patescibacteria group bacterium]